MTTVDLSRIDHPEDVLVHWAYFAEIHLMQGHFEGKFAHLRRMSADAIRADLLKHELALQPDLERRVEQFWTEHLGVAAIGVHARYSDRRARLELILKRLDALARTNPDVPIFLATDNVAVKELIERRHPAVVSAPHWYPEPGASLHHSPRAPDRFANGVGALVDAYLLGRCRYLIVDSRSSLARVALLLAAQNAARVTDVKPLRRLPYRARKLAKPLLDRLGLRELTWDGIVLPEKDSSGADARDW